MVTLTVKKKDGTEAEVTAIPVQVPPRKWGDHSQSASQIDVTQSINPATNLPYAQVTQPSRGGMISPPPTKNFK